MLDEPELITTIDPHKLSPSKLPNEEPKGLAPNPVPAVVEREEPSAKNLPDVKSIIAKRALGEGLEVVDAERDGNVLYLVVEGPGVEEVQGSTARQLAYDARYHYSFIDAGIELHGGASPENGKYRQTYKLTKGL